VTDWATAASEDQTRVFVCYSRKDTEFLTWLSAGLRERGCFVDYDQSPQDPKSITGGIAAEDAWWTRLEEMITAAEVVVFVLSPDSARSPVCDEEIAFAQARGKRVVPVLWRPIDFQKAPPRLSALNVKISFVTPDAGRLAASLDELVAAIRTDVRWFRMAGRLSTAARQWDLSGREPDQLLRGTQLTEAEAWAARRPPAAPAHSEMLLEFLADSRAAEEERAALAAIEQLRYRDFMDVLRPFLEAEIRIREGTLLLSHEHEGHNNELRNELEFLRSMLREQRRWHLRPAVWVKMTGADDGYASVFRFPCCGQMVWDYRSAGNHDAPSQIRDDGCGDLPATAIRHRRERSNPFTSVLARRYWKSIEAIEALREKPKTDDPDHFYPGF
jgi:hypothetical protein